MRIPKSIQAMVVFANWCSNYGVRPSDAAKLLVLARHASNMAAKDASEPGYEKKAERANRRFEQEAVALGFEVCWDSAWPSLRKDGKHTYFGAW